MTYRLPSAVLAFVVAGAMSSTLDAQQLASASRAPIGRTAADAADAAGATVPRRAPRAERAPALFWLTYGDTTLRRLMMETLLANHDLQIASARMSGARAARNGAAFELGPVVTASSGYTRQRFANAAFPGLPGGTLPDQGVWDAGLRMNWEIDVFGRLRHSLQGRGALLSAAGEDLKDVQVILTAQVAQAYFALRGAQDRLVVARRNAENQRHTLDVTRQRLEAGRGTALDTERAQAQLSLTLAVIPTLEATVAAARNRIGVLTGRASGDVPSLEPNGVMAELPDSLALTRADSLVRHRPDVRSAERQLAARSAFVGAARAEYLPRVAVGGAAGYTSSRFDALGNAGTPRYAIGPVISWPALDLGRVRANVDAARADEAEGRARYEQSVLLAVEEVETSLVTYNKARERLRHLDDAASASERAAELARLRFAEGASDFLQVLDAERTLLEAQDRRAQAFTEATTGLVTVYRAVGGEWPGR